MSNTIDFLRNCLLSTTNVAHIANLIMENYVIVSSARAKCEKMISQTINKEINNLGPIPSEFTNTDMESLMAIINEKAIDNFESYLRAKCPGKNIYRPNSVLKQQRERNINTGPVVGAAVTEPTATELIMTEEDVNKLLQEKSVQVLHRAQVAVSREQFFEYMSNAEVIKMIQQLINNLNQSNPMSGQLDPVHTVKPGDRVISEDEVKILLERSRVKKHKKKIAKTVSEPVVPIVSVPIPVTVSDPVIDISEDISIDDEVIADEVDPSEEAEAFYNEIKSDSPLDEKLFGERIEEIVQWIKYFESKETTVFDDTIKKLNREKEDLIKRLVSTSTSTSAGSTDTSNQPKKKSKKSKKDSVKKRFEDESDPNVEYLDLEIDTSNDIKDIKNLTIKLNSNRKIQEIILVDYYLPFNSHNITRFNNTFGIVVGGKMMNIQIPPSTYSIQTLLGYLGNQLTFLNFSLGVDGIVTITNKMNIKFSLIQGENNILSTLGFRTKIDSYSDKVSFVGSHPYNLDANKKIFFQLSSASMDPMELEFDKKITKECTIKKNRLGINLKHITMRFVDELERCYDFLMPFNICFKIIYLEK